MSDPINLDLHEEASELNPEDVSLTRETKKDVNISKKLTSSEWNAIEQQLSPFIKKVIECLKNLGSNKFENIDKDQYKVIGDRLYLQIRPKLQAVGLVFKITDAIDKNDIQKMNKKDQIRMNNMLTTLNKIIDDTLKSFSGDFTPFNAFNNKILEVKGIGLLYGCYYINEKHKTYNKPEHLPFVFNIMVACQRYINVCKSYKTQMFMNSESGNVSKTLINDLELWFNHLKKVYPYSGFAISDYAPQLFVHTEYDEAIPTVGIKPRNHQTELYSSISKNHNDGYMVIYNAPIGGGKTSAIIILASYVMSLRHSTSDKKLQIIFACNLQAVRLQVSNMCYNGKIPFGVASFTNTGYKITNHVSCKDNSERIVIVASPDVAFAILDDKKNGDTSDKYILYLDEPTTGADVEVSESLKSNMKVLVTMPKRTILVSATFPNQEHIQPITNSFKYKYNRAKILNINSGEIYIGCNVKTFDNELVVPHLGVKTKEELVNIIESIKTWSVLKRIYTVNVIKDLYNKMIANKCSDIPNVPELFTNVDNMNCTNVGIIAIDMLNALLKHDNEIIETVCRSKITSSKIELDIKEEVKEESYEWSRTDVSEIDNPENPLLFNKLGTTQAYRLTGGTLIRTDEDCQFCFDNFKDLIDKIENTNISSTSQMKYKSASNIFSIYKKDVDEYNKKLKTEEGNPRRLQQYDYERFISEFKDVNKPKIKFPDFGQINTEEHLEKYAGKNGDRVINKRTHLNLESYNINQLNVSDHTLTLLMAGVGMYMPNSELLDNTSNNLTLELASSQGKLAYTVADDSLCYGTDFPINNCIFVRKRDSKVSINTIFQFMGRAGRVGKSWISNFYIDDGIAKMIIDFARNSKQIQTEAINMNIVFEREQQKYIDAYNEKIASIMKEEKEKEQKLHEEKIRNEKIQEEKTELKNNWYDDDAVLDLVPDIVETKFTSEMICKYEDSSISVQTSEVQYKETSKNFEKHIDITSVSIKTHIKEKKSSEPYSRKNLERTIDRKKSVSSWRTR